MSSDSRKSPGKPKFTKASSSKERSGKPERGGSKEGRKQRTEGAPKRGPRTEAAPGARGKNTNRFDEPSRGKSRRNDEGKGQTRRNSLPMKEQQTGFKVSRVKGKKKELVWEPRDKSHQDDSGAGKKRLRPTGFDREIRLNRYIANAGICSRREADVLIQAGAVRVNGEVVTEMGIKVGPDDVVHYGEQRLKREKNVYVLLNKPKDFVTTTRDPEGRKTVMHLVREACREQILPVGRLDRQTTGLLLFTNDGDIAKKLTHPKHKVTKLYHIHTDKKVAPADIDKLLAGVKLDDGIAVADKVSFVGESQRELGMEIHSGKNRVVRRMMEHLGYKVVKLDRVMIAGLTKKNLPRGHWRFLTEEEVNRLKML